MKVGDSMGISLTILKSLEFIEENLKEDIDLYDVSYNVGYSKYYFSRMFKNEMGISVMEYIRDRRLIKSSEEIIIGRKIIDIALDYGYKTHSGFTKAFKKKFSYSPAFLKIISMEIDYIGGRINMKDIWLEENYIHETEESLYRKLIEIIKENELRYDLDNILKAYKTSSKAFEGEKRYSGDGYITHLLNISIILADINVEEDILIAGLLYETVDKNKISIDIISKEFSNNIVNIIKDINNFKEYDEDIKEEVLIIKLVERLHNMRTLEFLDKDRWEEKAKETIKIYLPMAIKIDNKRLMEELNDISLKYIF